MTLKHEGKLYLWNNKNAKNIKSEISTSDFSSYIENMRENYSGVKNYKIFTYKPKVSNNTGKIIVVE